MIDGKGTDMVKEKDWYLNLPNRARHYMYTSFLMAIESKDRDQVAADLKTAMSELVDENEKQAAEIMRLRGILKIAGIAF